MRVALICGAFKPYHKGHDKMIRTAATECDYVCVFASAKDRGGLGHDRMATVWSRHILSILPSNVQVLFFKNPMKELVDHVRMVGASQQGYSTRYVIYCDHPDIKNFRSLGETVSFRGVDRKGLSGTEMRRYLATGKKAEFLAGLPERVDGEAIWRLLCAGD